MRILGAVIFAGSVIAQEPGVYKVGGGVSPPSVIYKSDPEYSHEARRAIVQATVVLRAVVNSGGRSI